MYNQTRSPPPDDDQTVILEKYHSADPDRFLSSADQRRIAAFNKYDTEHEPLEYPSTIITRRHHNSQTLSALAVYHLIQLETAIRRTRHDIRGELYAVEDILALCGDRLSEDQLRARLWKLRDAGLLTNRGSKRYLQLAMTHRELGEVFEEHVDQESRTTVYKFSQSNRGSWYKLPLGWTTDGLRRVVKRLFWNERLTGWLCLLVFGLGTLTILPRLFEGHPVDEAILVRAYWLTWFAVSGFIAVGVGSLRRLAPRGWTQTAV